MSRIARSMNKVVDSIDALDYDWHLDAADLIEEYTNLEDDSPAQDAAMYITGRDGVYLFDILFATYLYCVDYHEGQGSEEYAVLSQLKAAGLKVAGSIEDQDESIQQLFERMVEVHHA
jgi:hypothetical protein